MLEEGIFDIHCHIVPGVDDGAADIEETRKLLEMEYIFLANTLFYEYLNIFLLTGLSFFCNDGQDESEQDSY